MQFRHILPAFFADAIAAMGFAVKVLCTTCPGTMQVPIELREPSTANQKSGLKCPNRYDRQSLGSVTIKKPCG